MAYSDFSYDDLWHNWAASMLDFVCNECAEMVGFHWSADGFNTACVETAAEARDAGWTCVDWDMFLCPKCSRPKRRDAG